jgi:hypothetical protein
MALKISYAWIIFTILLALSIPRNGNRRVAAMSRISASVAKIRGHDQFWRHHAVHNAVPKLKAVYNVTEENSLNDRWLGWSVTDYAQRYCHERLEAHSTGNSNALLPP